MVKQDDEQAPSEESTLQVGGSQGQVYDGVDPSSALDNTRSLLPPLLQDDESSREAEHEMFPSAKEASVDVPLMASNLGGDRVENGEHGIFPSPLEVHGDEIGENGIFPSPLEALGVENTTPTPICLIDVVPILREHESHQAHLS